MLRLEAYLIVVVARPSGRIIDVAVLGALSDPAGRIGVLESRLPDRAGVAPIEHHVAVAVVMVPLTHSLGLVCTRCATHARGCALPQGYCSFFVLEAGFVL